VFIVVLVVYFVMTQSGNFWIHPRTFLRVIGIAPSQIFHFITFSSHLYSLFSSVFSNRMTAYASKSVTNLTTSSVSFHG
jgi:hypothetical protein